MKCFISRVLLFSFNGQTPHQAMLTTTASLPHAAEDGASRWMDWTLALRANDAQIWEKALRKLRGRQMPPPGSPQPPQKISIVCVWMENTLDTQPQSQAAMCRFSAEPHRYAATVKALVGVEVNAKEFCRRTSR